ncbi:MAG: hypothetical protein COA43_04090 [Robiginitomaculum sp.]|nr:MAG: hypothetical protein COA43_04090 [Robiginitomaculum sp.]
MTQINIPDENKKVLLTKIQTYFNEELNQDIGRFEVQFLLDFLEKEMGAYYYNQGLYDAQALLIRKMELLTEAIYEIEKPTD